MNELTPRPCTMCGKSFTGYGRAMYCPACQPAYKKEKSRRAQIKRTANYKRDDWRKMYERKLELKHGQPQKRRGPQECEWVLV